MSTALKLSSLQKFYAKEWAKARGFDQKYNVERSYKYALYDALKGQPNPDKLVDAAIRNMKAIK